MALEVRQSGLEDLNGAAFPKESMPLNETKEAQDLFGGRVSAGALLGIEGEIFDALPVHGQTQLALNEGLEEKRQEVYGEERLDSAFVFEKHGSHFVHGLDLLESLLDHGRTLVRLKHFGR